MVRSWLHGRIDDSGAAGAAALAVEAVCGVGSAEEAQEARRHGVEPWTCLGAFSAAEDEADLLCRSLDGQPRRWFGSGCPNHPTVRQRLLDRLLEVAEWPVAGVLLDGIRFASPYEGRDTYFTCACEWCRYAAERLGFRHDHILEALNSLTAALDRQDPADLGRVVAGLQSPADLLPLLHRRLGLIEWLEFRAAVIHEVVAAIEEALAGAAPAVQLGAYLFTPSLAPLVGQDYAALSDHLRLVSPMIYRFGDGPACLPAEALALAAIAGSGHGEAATGAVLATLGLRGSAGGGLTVDGGMTVDAIARETTRARARLRGGSLVPILWLDDPDIEAASAAALAGNPDGLSYFATGADRRAHLARAAAFLRSRNEDTS